MLKPTSTSGHLRLGLQFGAGRHRMCSKDWCAEQSGARGRLSVLPDVPHLQDEPLFTSPLVPVPAPLEARAHVLNWNLFHDWRVHGKEPAGVFL